MRPIEPWPNLSQWAICIFLNIISKYVIYCSISCEEVHFAYAHSRDCRLRAFFFKYVLSDHLSGLIARSLESDETSEGLTQIRCNRQSIYVFSRSPESNKLSAVYLEIVNQINTGERNKNVKNINLNTLIRF